MTLYEITRNAVLILILILLYSVASWYHLARPSLAADLLIACFLTPMSALNEFLVLFAIPFTTVMFTISLLPNSSFYYRTLLSFASLVVCAAYGTVASAILRIVGYGGLSQWTVARSFKWTMWLTTGVEFVIQDEEHLRTRPAVFIGNHQTYVSSTETLRNNDAPHSTVREGDKLTKYIESLMSSCWARSSRNTAQ